MRRRKFSMPETRPVFQTMMGINSSATIFRRNAFSQYPARYCEKFVDPTCIWYVCQWSVLPLQYFDSGVKIGSWTCVRVLEQKSVIIILKEGIPRWCYPCFWGWRHKCFGWILSLRKFNQESTKQLDSWIWAYLQSLCPDLELSKFKSELLRAQLQRYTACTYAEDFNDSGKVAQEITTAV